MYKSIKDQKNNTIPNNRKIVVLLGIIIFLNEYVGNLLMSNKEVKIKKVGTIIL